MTNENAKSIDKPLEQIAIITYNRVGGGQYQNGWLEYPRKKALLIQNKEGARIGLPLWMFVTNPNAKEICKTKMESLFEGMTSTLKQMDQIYVYVGLGGANDAIRLTKDLPPQKISSITIITLENAAITMPNSNETPKRPKPSPITPSRTPIPLGANGVKKPANQDTAKIAPITPTCSKVNGMTGTRAWT